MSTELKDVYKVYMKNHLMVFQLGDLLLGVCWKQLTTRFCRNLVIK